MKIRSYQEVTWRQTGQLATRGRAVAVLVISLNEGHHMDDVLRRVEDWAQEVFPVNNTGRDETVQIALDHGPYGVQRPFSGFGDQWIFAA